MSYRYRGFDVSRHQGKIDWERAVRGQDFVIIRAGYGRLASQADSRFYENIKAAAEAGIGHIGVYWYSYAADAADAKREAEACLAVIGKVKALIDLPVFFDQEYEPAILSADKNTRTEAARVFCEEMKKAGYRPGFYGSQDWLLNKIDREALPEGTVIWCAKYSETPPRLSHTVWQQTSKGSLSGVAGQVDIDLAGEELVAARWEKTADGWRYGGYRERWAKLKGSWYYFDGGGIAVTGWKKVEGKWYYFLTQADAELTGEPECACFEKSE